MIQNIKKVRTKVLWMKRTNQKTNRTIIFNFLFIIRYMWQQDFDVQYVINSLSLAIYVEIMSLLL